MTKEFNSYIIYHQETIETPEKVIINCYYDDRTVGHIHFYDGPVPKPEVITSGALKLTFGIDRFEEIIDTIRFEKPLYLSLFGKKSVISTVKEPVGEQEGI
jgi:hypothetical protein